MLLGVILMFCFGIFGEKLKKRKTRNYGLRRGVDLHHSMGSLAVAKSRHQYATA